MSRMSSLCRGVLACALSLWSATALAIIDDGQGTHLHDTGDLENVNIWLASHQPANCGVAMSQGELAVQSPCNLPLTDIIWTAPYDGGIASFKITAVDTHSYTPRIGPVAPPRKKYEVKVTRGPTYIPEQATYLCGAQGRFALAVPFAWTTSGELLDAPGYFTFACLPYIDDRGAQRGGAIAKCVNWGYPPWADANVAMNRWFDVNPGMYDAATAKRFHQTCVRMATADYCGEGNANTIDGTPIDFKDSTNMVASGQVQFDDPLLTFSPVWLSGPSSPTLLFESVWGVDGCGRVRVLCLSRARWDTLSLAATCVDGVMARRAMTPAPAGAGICTNRADFEVGQNKLFWSCPQKPWIPPVKSSAACAATCGSGGDGGVPPPSGQSCVPSYDPPDPLTELEGSSCGPVQPPGICESWTLQDLLAGGATLFTYSAYWDRALVSFEHQDGRRITTTAVTHDDPNPTKEELRSFTMSLESGFTQLRYEGKLFHPDLPAGLRNSLGELRPLYRCRNTKDAKPTYLLTTTPDCDRQPGFTMVQMEGYLYAKLPSVESVPIYLWQKVVNANLVRFATSAVQPPDYQRVGTEPLGYLPLPSRLAYRPPPAH